VKTTRKSRHEHEISRLDQLRVLRDASCCSYPFNWNSQVGGDETLATRVDAVVDLLRSDAAALDTS